MRLAIDTGGTFTDLVIEDTGPPRSVQELDHARQPTRGILNVLALAAADRRCTTRELLERTDLLIYATTRAINAVITQTAARTALLTTEGHPDDARLPRGRPAPDRSTTAASTHRRTCRAT